MEKQQANPEGHRHSKTSGNLSRLENPLVRYHPAHQNWIQAAQNRQIWTKQSLIFSCRARGIPEPESVTSQSEKHTPTEAPPKPKAPQKRPRSASQNGTPQDPNNNEPAPALRKLAKKVDAPVPELPWEQQLQLPLSAICPQASHGCRFRGVGNRNGERQSRTTTARYVAKVGLAEMCLCETKYLEGVSHQFGEC